MLVIGIFLGIGARRAGGRTSGHGIRYKYLIMGQLRLTDFTLAKIILTAILTTTLGIVSFIPWDKIEIKTKSGSIKNALIAGLIFGLGFGILACCPGTIATVVGNGYLDALTGGFIGTISGTIIFALI